MRFLGALAGVLLSIGAFWSFHLRDPHLFHFRKYETAVLLGLLAVTAALAKVISQTWLRRTLRVAAFVLLAMVAITDFKIREINQRVASSPTEDERRINARLILGFSSFDQVEPLARNGIAGIFVGRRNVSGKNFQELRESIARLQAVRKEVRLPPLIVATDEEGGMVSQLSPLVEKQPRLDLLAGANHGPERAFEYGKQQGRQLAELGITVNFSPVVDLKPAGEIGALDRNTRILTRAISASPREVTDIALPYIQGLQSQNVAATLKHFPGLGRVTADTHHFAADLDATETELMASDWLPFADISGRAETWIMLAHVVLNSVDDENPVSTSSRVVDQIIRKKLGFQGKLVTDDLTMGATYNRGFCRSIIGAFQADIDYLLIAYDHEKYFDAVRCLTDGEGRMLATPRRP